MSSAILAERLDEDRVLEVLAVGGVSGLDDGGELEDEEPSAGSPSPPRPCSLFPKKAQHESTATSGDGGGEGGGGGEAGAVELHDRKQLRCRLGCSIL